MNDKKHIDRLFQEKLKDFEATPNDAVWKNISSQLQHQDKDKPYLPLWMKIAGLAAALLLLVAIGSVVLGGDNNPVENTIVNTTDDTDVSPSEQNQVDTSLEENTLDSESISTEDSVADEVNSFEKSNTFSTLGQSNFAEQNDQNKNKNSSNVTTNVATSNIKKGQPKNQQKETINSQKRSSADAVVKQETDKVNRLNQATENDKMDRSKADELLNAKKANDEAIVNRTDETTTDALETNQENPEDKPSIVDELEKQDDLTEDDEEKEKAQRWSVSPHVSPVYFNAFGNGSSIDQQFDNSPRSGDINLSYGVLANYKLNDKLSIRAGVNKLNLGYSTNNVIVYNNVDPLVENPPLKHVKMNSYGQTLSFLSADGLNFAQVPGVVSNNIQSSIDQNLGFVEVPLELEYKLSTNKVGISLIGGFSSLFLSDNEVYTTLQGEKTLLGEATNIRKTSFSANIGVGFDFTISEKINLNLDPVMKYQLNTFSDTSGSFSPYTIGVQTGFSFKF